MNTKYRLVSNFLFIGKVIFWEDGVSGLVSCQSGFTLYFECNSILEMNKDSECYVSINFS